MYRKCVAIVVMDPSTNLCLVGKRARTKDGWQFPQGGVDHGETHEQAAKRELFEEMGIRGCMVEHYKRKCLDVSVSTCCFADINQALSEHEFSQKSYMPSVQFARKAGPFKYDYPSYVKRQEKGQEQIWFLAYKNECVKDLNVVLNDEFSDYEWMHPAGIMNYIVDFKKEVYYKGLSQLGLLCK